MSMSLGTNLALQLPVIDFTSPNLKPGTVEWDSVRGKVRKALEEYGCFEVLFDKVSKELRKAMLDASEDAFNLPLETKEKAVSEIKQYNGYIGQTPTTPLLEIMSVDYAEKVDKVDTFTQCLWPDGNKSFSEAVKSMTEKLSELDLMMRRMILESFGIKEKYIEKHLNSAKCLLRMMKYQGVKEVEEQLGMETHIDRDWITILFQNDVADGTEVKTKDGNHWIKVNASRDSSFIVVAGSMLHVLLNGRVHCVEHRVTRMGTETRYSAGLFIIPITGDIIYAPEEVVDADHPRLYKPVDYGAYGEWTTNVAGRRNLSALKTYCGL